MTTFSVIGTPIGNLGDITLRALETLKKADLILCEDTRMTKKLLSHYEISKPTLSYHAQSAMARTEDIVAHIRGGKNLALVSDAGTPGISDPGSHLVQIIRTEFTEELASGELKIEAIPGPSALASALSIAGVPCADFTFLGFLPHKKGRETLFKEIAASERTMVFYESPHRIMKTLERLTEQEEGQVDSQQSKVEKMNGKNQKLITVCRELTKIFEQVVQGSAADVKKYFDDNPDKVRGEFVVIVSIAS
ncbi:MAG: 16S rRNA (cytidine(1402)-2'-O)-methyltransferase [Candidatus Pacebacteria bacterium]|nr:16S rRNA (cytidine(1402)-2'-O)-methyltransferase [Candidatus Paceibacterota bacterium]